MISAIADKPIEQPKTFDELWCESEALTVKRFQNKTPEQIINEIVELLSNYHKLCQVVIPEVQTSLKKRYMGELLFVLSALTLKDDLNIHPLLQEQIVINRFITK